MHYKFRLVITRVYCTSIENDKILIILHYALNHKFSESVSDNAEQQGRETKASGQLHWNYSCFFHLVYIGHKQYFIFYILEPLS